jgi:hypothetical protein
VLGSEILKPFAFADHLLKLIVADPAVSQGRANAGLVDCSNDGSGAVGIANALE